MFAGPAAVIWGYQNLIKLSGKNPDDAFPEGPWQFYVDYSMREDTARHANETRGFDTELNRQQTHLDPVDRITAWVLTAIDSLHHYEAMLANEWRERVYTQLLIEITQQALKSDSFLPLYQRWERQRPYGLDPTLTDYKNYPDYRKHQFDQFLVEQSRTLPPDVLVRWKEQIRSAEAEELPAYQRQMSILAYLSPDTYGESRVPLTLNELHIGVIHRGNYYLIPACKSGTDRKPAPDVVRAQVAAILAAPANQVTSLIPLARMQRKNWPRLRGSLNDALVQEFDRLKTAPILLNCQADSPRLPLSELRQAERGVGDHALTIFDTGASFVFDQSHVFFDGAWGAMLAEIMTQSALNWATWLSTLPPLPSITKKIQPLQLHIEPAEMTQIQAAPQAALEVSSETTAVDLKAMQKLRRLFKQRNDLLNLTINDLLILYRAIFAATYQPSPALVSELKQLAQVDSCRTAVEAALNALTNREQLNPAIVIPVDGSHRLPSDRLCPFTFAVPLTELDLLSLHRQVMAALTSYRQATDHKAAGYARFDELQRVYLSNLAGFGELSSRAKEVARQGDSTSVGALRLLAHLPASLQRLLEHVPNRFDMLNDLIKGREVFSNVGAVAPSSTLSRFISAKDDNEKKTLVWGVLTDAQGRNADHPTRFQAACSTVDSLRIQRHSHPHRPALRKRLC